MSPSEVLLSDLAILLFGSECDDKAIVVIGAYFDDSGTEEESSAVVVGGLIATAESWVAFQKKWRATLDEYGLDCFHMTDCEGGFPPFDKLTKDERIVLTTKLIALTQVHTQAIVNAATHKEDYEKYKKSQTGYGAYPWTVYQCLGGVADWADRLGYRGPIVYFFDKGGGSKALGRKGELDRLRDSILADGRLARTFRLDQLESWNYDFMKNLSPLQAADIVAYESWKELMNGYFPEIPTHPQRKSMTALLGVKQVFSGYFDKEVFLAKQGLVPKHIHGDKTS
jgi:hypothetical protein